MTRAERHRVDYARVVAGLVTAGIDVESLSEINKRGPEVMERALPTLIRWLDSADIMFTVKTAIVLELSRHTRKLGADFYLGYYEGLKPVIEDEETAGFAWRLADCAQEELRAGDVDRVLTLIQDESYGKAREMLIYGLRLRKFKRRNDIIPVVLVMVEDETVRTIALDVLGKLKALEAAPRLTLMLSDSDPDWRYCAQKALKRIGVEIPETADQAELERYRAALDTMVVDHVPGGLVGEMLGFEPGDLLSFFLDLAGRISEGFGVREAHNLAYHIRDMEQDVTDCFGFELTYRGEPTPLVIEVGIDEEDCAEIHFATSQILLDVIVDLADDES